MICPICELRMQVDRLREEDEAVTIEQANNGGVRAFVNMKEDKTSITIYGAIRKDHLDSLLNLLVDIDREKIEAPSSTGQDITLSR